MARNAGRAGRRRVAGGNRRYEPDAGPPAGRRGLALPGIPVAWIVEINGRRVEVYTPRAPGYGASEVFAEVQSVPVVIDGREVGRIAVADILPTRRPEPEAEGDGT